MNTNYFVLFFCLIAVVFVVTITYFVRKIKKINNKYFNNIKLIANTVNSVRYGNLSARLVLVNDKKYPNLAESINRMVETIQDREKMISEFRKEITSHNIFLETLINSLSDGFLILDENFKILKMTQVAKNLLGNNAEGALITDFIEFNPSDFVASLNSFNTVLKNDVSKYLSVKISNLNIADNFSFKYLVTIKDISKEHELANIKNDFIATLAHDLRVPLIAESNTLNLLKDGKFGQLDVQLNEVVQLLIQSNKDIIMLTDVLLETYKLEQAKLVLSFHETNINDIVKDVCDELSSVASVNSININLHFCDDFFANVDVFQFKRVLRNIINNSIDYSSQISDKIDIYTSCDNDSFSVKVRDYGTGISDAEKGKIFQKFYSGAHKFRKVGSGLGLYLANEIVKAHNGKINIISEPNLKTDFEICIPLGC